VNDVVTVIEQLRSTPIGYLVFIIVIGVLVVIGLALWVALVALRK